MPHENVGKRGGPERQEKGFCSLVTKFLSLQAHFHSILSFFATAWLVGNDFLVVEFMQ